MRSRRDPLPLSDALAELTAKLKPATTLAEVQGHWAEAVGATISTWARPVSERGGIVTVACRDSVTAHELQLQKTTIIGRLNELVESATIKNVKFKIS